MQTGEQHTDYKVLYEQAQAVNEQLKFKITALEHQLSQITKMIFGSKHERFVSSDNTGNLQLKLNLEVETIEACKITDATKVAYIRTKTQVMENKKPHPGRMKLPEHLRRETTILQPETDVTKLKKIGEEVQKYLITHQESFM